MELYFDQHAKHTVALLFIKTSRESLIVLTEALRLSNTLPSCGPGYGNGPSAEAVYCLIALVALF